MSGFWETFDDANEVAAASLGEAMLIGGVVVQGVVSGMLSMEDGAAPGGRRYLPSGEVVVPGSVAPCDGLRCTVRGIECKIEGWDRLGASGRWVLRLGPVNRWSGDIPGT